MHKTSGDNHNSYVEKNNSHKGQDWNSFDQANSPLGPLSEMKRERKLVYSRIYLWTEQGPFRSVRIFLSKNWRSPRFPTGYVQDGDGQTTNSTDTRPRSQGLLSPSREGEKTLGTKLTAIKRKNSTLLPVLIALNFVWHKTFTRKCYKNTVANQRRR